MRLGRPGASSLLIVGTGLWLFRAALLGDVFYKRDIHLVWVAQVEAFVRAVTSGAWPVWDPGPAFGQPLLADPSAQVLYPPTWLNLLMRPWVYYTFYAVGHFLLGAFGMRALARRLGLSRAGALLAALVFALSGPFLSQVDLWHHYAGAAWMPWVVLAADRALGGGRREVTSFAAALGLQVLAGSADQCAMTLLLAAGLGAVRHLDFRAPASLANRAVLARGFSGVLLGVGLGSAAWLSALEVVSRAARAELPQAVRTYWSLHPLVALETLLPGLWSTLPLTEELRALFFESREPFFSSLHFGVSALCLLVAAAVASRHPLRGPLLLALVLALLAAMGPHTPVHGLITTLLPPLRILRYPVKIMTAAAFAWSLLAGLGLDACREGRASRRIAIAITVPATLVALAAALLAAAARYAPGRIVGPVVALPEGVVSEVVLGRALLRLLVPLGISVVALAMAWAVARGRLSPGAAGTALAAAAALDLVSFHRTPNPTAPRALYTFEPDVLRAIGERAAARVYVYDYSVPGKVERYLEGRSALRTARVPEGWSLDPASALGMQMYLAPETAGRWGLSAAWNVDLRGLHASALTRLSRLLRDAEGIPQHLRLLQAGGTTHAISLHPMADLEPSASLPGLFEREILLQKVPSPLPRVYVAARARATDDEGAVAFLLDASADLRNEVAIDAGAAAKVPEPPSSPGGGGGVAHITHAGSDRVVIEAELTGHAHVVLLDTWDPGWKATVDGRPVPLLRANLVFRAVRTGPGRHVIEMVYRPRGLGIGLAVSGLCVALVAFMARPLPKRHVP